MGDFKLEESRHGITIKKEGCLCKLGKLLLCIFVILLFLLFTLKFAWNVQSAIKGSLDKLAVTNDLNATWIGSLASYWGAIIGGIISGVLTCLGVLWTIKYYKNSDKIKSRLEFMPFLNIEVENMDKKKFDIVAEEKNTFTINGELIESDSKVKKIYYKIKIKNIGRGFANTLVIQNGENHGGIIYKKLIQVNDSNEFYFEINIKNNFSKDKIEFGILYIDCMTNEYIQTYEMQFKRQNLDDVDLDVGYPNFIGQTHKIGKS